MRIAAISDIHGNGAALEAIWSTLADENLIGSRQTVLNAGDTVAYGPDTMACINFVRDPARHIVSVGGNYDVNVSRFPEKRDHYHKKWGKLRPDKFESLQNASDELSGDGREWLAALPSQIELTMEDARISLSHYVPGSTKEGLFSNSPPSRLEQIAAELNGRYDIVVTGHTHSAFARVVGGVLFVNPGSIGRSWGAPTYAEITIEPGVPPTARILPCHVTPR